MAEHRRTAEVTPLGVVGWQVDCCCIAEDARLLFLYPPPNASEISAFELSLRTPFRLRLATGRETLLDPAGAREELAPLLALYRRTVADAVVGDDGTLTVDFADGATLVAEPDPVCEAWELRGPRNEQVVCLPAGDGIVTFGGARSHVGD